MDEHISYSDAGARSATRKKTIIGAIITALVSFLFFSLYWNRFLGLRSGSGAYTGGHHFSQDCCLTGTTSLLLRL